MKNKYVRSALKFLLAGGILAYVISRSEAGKIWHYMVNIEWQYLLGAFLLLNMAQLFSAMRMRYYFHKAGLKLRARFALAIYYVGMFYNLILPGGIGGDGYNVYLLKRTAGFPLRTSIRLLLSCRASGLFVLILLMFVSALLIDVSHHIQHAWVIILLGYLVVIPSYFILARLILGEPFMLALGAMRFSVPVQCFTLIAMLTVWAGMGDGQHMPVYALLFQLAAILGMLPLFPGGLGIREMTFSYGAILLNQWADLSLDPEFGVALSLTFFGVSAISSMAGFILIDKVTHMQPVEEPYTSLPEAASDSV